MPSARPKSFEAAPEPAASKFQPSPLQQAIFHWFKDGSGNAVVRARAGAGKTTTIVHGVRQAPEQDVLVTTHTRRMMEELASRFEDDADRVFAKGLHAVGFRAIRRFSGGKRGYPRFVCDRFEREESLAGAVTGGMPFGAKRLVGKLVTLARELEPVTATVASLIAMAEENDLVPEWSSKLAVDDIARATLRAMDIAASDFDLMHKTGIDYADMLFLPLRNSLLRPEFDLGVIDEAQDATMTQLLIFEGVMQPGGRMVVVGDDRQAIFGFRGADSDSLDRLKRELNATEFPLSQTYRCPRLIVALARTIVPDIEALDGCPEGTIDEVDGFADVVHQAREGDFILSRTNAPLAKIALGLLRAQKRARIQGRDIGATVRALVRKMAGTGRGNQETDNIDVMLGRLRDWREREVQKLLAMNREDKAERADDLARTIEALADDATCVSGLIARIDYLFTDNVDGVIVCSTVHKAKGLEADRVFALRPTFSLPVPCDCGHMRKMHVDNIGFCIKCGSHRCGRYSPSEAARREEQNIRYVTITRAKAHLTWVNER